MQDIYMAGQCLLLLILLVSLLAWLKGRRTAGNELIMVLSSAGAIFAQLLFLHRFHYVSFRGSRVSGSLALVQIAFLGGLLAFLFCWMFARRDKIPALFRKDPDKARRKG